MGMRFAAVFLAVFCATGAFAQDTEQRDITISATGVASATPDLAVLQIAIVRQGDTAAEAMNATAEASTEVLDAIKATGISTKDVQNSAINLFPIFQSSRDGQDRKLIGYTASNDMTIRVRFLDRLGNLMDKVVTTGANQMSGLRFDLSNREEIEQIARANAMKQAQTNASTLAEAAGLALGPILSIQEGVQPRNPIPMNSGAMMKAQAASMPVASGELDVRVNVHVVFAIE